MFLDIETTGLSRYYHQITVIGFSLAGKYTPLIAGDNPAVLIEACEAADTVVTFNGSQFDLPFIAKEYPHVRLPTQHLDLRYACRYAGLTGGQKKIEKLLGISREIDVDGPQAVLLWHQYVAGDTEALSRLIEYNYLDVYGMAKLLDHVDTVLSDGTELFEPGNFASRILPLEMKPAADHPSPASRGLSPLTFAELFDGTVARDAVIVGLDLTGSEARPSGAAISRGNQVETATLAADNEILEYVRAAAPDIVSIDSPLCLPAGRTSVFDDDPARAEYGILRECERILKRRGINVYPCLLPSMQRLTKRGMTLADALRREGIPVIESYPGAAQDIVGIARKGAGVRFLAAGLRAFGYHGPIDHEVITHDELDAITCTMVGSFFLARMFEAVGTDQEDPLIIPDLDGTELPVVVGVSGRISAGKSTFARELEKAGFGYVRYSQIVDEVIGTRGLVPDRDTRQRVGQELNQGFGQRWLGKRLIERMQPGQFWVVDGLRFKEDYAFWVERLGKNFHHVHIAAPERVRRDRYSGRKIGEDAFKAIDRAPVEREIDDLSRLADTSICNEHGLTKLVNFAWDFAKGFTLASSVNFQIGRGTP